MFNKIKLFFIILKETFSRRLYYWKKSKYFIEWDYNGLLLAEKAFIKRMLDTYDGSEEMNDKQLNSLRTALKLLNIVLGETDITESEVDKDKIHSFPEEIFERRDYKLLIPINVKNAKRFLKKDSYDLLQKYKEEPLFLEEYYRQKAFYIYNMYRTHNLYTWWT